MKSIVDNLGNVFEFNQENGLISKNNVIVSGADYEPVFQTSPDNSYPPVFVGIFLKREGSVLSMSGNIKKLINSRQL